MRALLPIILLASVFLGSCASGGGSPRSDVRRDPNLITQEDLSGQPAGTAYDAVQRLRPTWLRSRGTLSMGTTGTGSLPRVFVADRDFGALRSLRDIQLDSVSEIEFMSARDATTRYGTGYAGGIIHVRLKTSPRCP